MRRSSGVFLPRSNAARNADSPSSSRNAPTLQSGTREKVTWPVHPEGLRHAAAEVASLSVDGVVLIVVDVFEPFDGLAIELLLHGDVCHGCRR